MADSILKLRVESSEYDAKLKKAAEGIRHLADVAHQGGGELTGLEKAELDYVKALGTMETRSRTAAGSVRELESTYKELKVIYDQLNDVEKADEGGKALAASLEQIKQRAQEARAQLDNASKSLNDNGQEAQQSSSALDALASKFTINIDALKLFNIGLQAAKGALDVAKDAFMSSEANVDEWGRVIDSSKSLYEGFLTALNTGDISGYLNNIDSIVQAARTAYNELDRLGTMKTIQAPQMSAQQTENERIRSMIQTGRYIAPIDGRRNTVFNGREMQSGDKLTAGQIRALEKQLQNGMQKVVTLVGNEVKQTGKAIDAVYNRQAKELGMDLSEFRKGTSSMAEFDKRMAGYDQYQKWRNENYYTDNWGNRRVKEGNPFEEYKKWGTFRVDGERYNDLVRLIQQRDQQAGQAYGMQSQSYRAMNRAEGFTVSKLMKGDTTKSGKSTKTEQTELQQNQTKINALTQEYVKLGNESTEAARERQVEIQKEIARLQQLNGLLNKRAEQAQGRLLSNDDIKRKAEIDMRVNTKQIEDLRKKLTEIEGVTIGPKSFTITATDEALPRLREIEGITIDNKTMTVTAETADALRALQGIEGVTIEPKSVTITATDKALPKLREIEGITIDDKTMTVTAETADALQALQGIEGVTIDPKSVTITATDEAMPKLREIDGITIDDKTMTVTAETADALRALQGIKGVTIDPKTIEVNANTSEAQQKIDDLKAKIAELEDKNINIKAFVDNVGKPLSEQQLSNTPGTLLKAPDTAIPSGGLQLDDKAMKAVQKSIDNQLKGVGNIADEWSGVASAIGAVGNAMAGIEDPAAKVLGIVAQAIATVALTFSKSLAGTVTPWDWIAAAAAGTATMISTISAIHSATGYAEGGMIKGNSYSGDNLMAMGPNGLIGLNAGEIVLNKSQQATLAQNLQGSGMQNLNLTATIKGEQIRLALNNNGRRTGRGEYVQSRNVR